MKTISTDTMEKLAESRRQIVTHCQLLVDKGVARWWINDDGNTELHMDSGEMYLFGELGVTRLM